MENYLERIGKRLTDINKVLGVDTKNMAQLIGIDEEILKDIEKDATQMNEMIARRIFIIANAQAKYEDESIKNLLKIIFDLEELNTNAFLEKIKTTHAA